jgi:hypothetical protein
MVQARNHSVVIASLSALAVYLSACGPSQPTEWEQHAYIWSRFDAAKPPFVPEEVDALRVLVAQWSVADDVPWFLESNIPATALTSEATIAVVRLDGSSIEVPAADVAQTLRSQLPHWRADWTPQVIEIDHDSATARLGDYTRWLREFRQAWGDQSPIWITALPDWRHSSSLGELLDAADAYTLQVHAIDASASGLLDAGKALEWAAQFEAASDTPYFVALPTYLLRVGRDEAGAVRFIESENRLGTSAAEEQTLFSDPQELVSLASKLRNDRTSKRKGIAWFRLPDSRDRNTLSAATFAALVSGNGLERKVQVRAVPVEAGVATFDLFLHNAGVHDTGLPRAIALDADCEVGDNASGYRATADRRHLERTSQGRLGSGQQASLGWIRCASGKPPEAVVQW